MEKVLSKIRQSFIKEEVLEYLPPYIYNTLTAFYILFMFVSFVPFGVVLVLSVILMKIKYMLGVVTLVLSIIPFLWGLRRLHNFNKFVNFFEFFSRFFKSNYRILFIKKLIRELIFNESVMISDELSSLRNAFLDILNMFDFIDGNDPSEEEKQMFENNSDFIKSAIEKYFEKNHTGNVLIRTLILMKGIETVLGEEKTFIIFVKEGLKDLFKKTRIIIKVKMY